MKLIKCLFLPRKANINKEQIVRERQRYDKNCTISAISGVNEITYRQREQIMKERQKQQTSNYQRHLLSTKINSSKSFS